MKNSAKSNIEKITTALRIVFVATTVAIRNRKRFEYEKLHTSVLNFICSANNEGINPNAFVNGFDFMANAIKRAADEVEAEDFEDIDVEREYTYMYTVVPHISSVINFMYAYTRYKKIPTDDTWCVSEILDAKDSSLHERLTDIMKYLIRYMIKNNIHNIGLTPWIEEQYTAYDIAKAVDTLEMIDYRYSLQDEIPTGYYDK